jgi:TP901 family phage tail tape measure protein
VALRTVGVKLMAEVSDYQRKMRDAAKSTRDLRTEMEQAAKGGQLDAIADQAAVAGVALVGMAGAAVKLGMDYEKAMSGVAAATKASAAEMEQLRQATLQAGKDTQYSATKAAQATTELAKAGVTTADILGGGLDGALDLAAAGQLDVAEAAETAASAMVQFKLKGKDLPHVADLLAAAAGKAQGTVHDMGQALNQAGLVAAQTGLSIEETTGGLAAFASAGLTGSDAGTSFKQMLLMLQAPSDKTKELMTELGISAYDSAGQFIGLTGLAQQLRDKMAKLTPELRANAMAQIFGADAVRGASILYEQGGAGIQDWINKVNDAGYASETAAKLTDNLAGDLERLKGSLETLAIESSGGANAGLRVLAKSAEAVVDQFGQLPSVVSGGMVVLTALGGVLALGAAAWVKMRSSNALALEELRNTGPGGERAARGLEATTKWAGRAAAAFVAAQIAAAGVSAAFGQNLNPQVTALADSLERWAVNGEQAGEATRLLGKDFEHLGYDLGTLGTGFWAEMGNGIAGTIESLTGFGDVADKSLTHAKERISAIDSALSQMVQNGQAAQAAAVFEKLAAEGKKAGISVDDLKKGLPQYTGVVQVAGKESAKTGADLTAMGNSAEDAAKKTEELAKQFEELFKQQMTSDRATLKLEESTVSLTEELTKGARTLALNSAEGRKNRTAVLDQLDAIEDLRQARIAEGETLDVANGKYKRDLENLRKAMTQANFTKKEIDRLIGSYEKIPDKVNTKVSATGVKGVEFELNDLLVKQRALQQGITPTQALGQMKRDLARTQQGKYAHGGWTGPGGMWDPAGVVHADEFVIKKASRNKIEQEHPGLLDEMNATGQLPGYARGGQVWPFPVTAANAKVPTMAQVAAAVTPDFGNWPSSPSAQRGDSGVWRQVLALIKSGPDTGSFGNAYRPGDPKWHGSGRAVDWMGYNQDALATFLAGKRPLELIHRTRNRDYAYTRGVNKGSFNNTLMEAHRNHIHIAMKNGGIIQEPVFGVGASGNTYSFGENWQPERVVPMTGGGGGGGTNVVINLDVSLAAGANPREAGRQIAEQLQTYLVGGGSIYVRGEKVLP